MAGAGGAGRAGPGGDRVPPPSSRGGAAAGAPVRRPGGPGGSRRVSGFSLILTQAEKKLQTWPTPHTTSLLRGCCGGQRGGSEPSGTAANPRGGLCRKGRGKFPSGVWVPGLRSQAVSPASRRNCQNEEEAANTCGRIFYLHGKNRSKRSVLRQQHALSEGKRAIGRALTSEISGEMER